MQDYHAFTLIEDLFIFLHVRFQAPNSERNGSRNRHRIKMHPRGFIVQNNFLRKDLVHLSLGCSYRSCSDTFRAHTACRRCYLPRKCTRSHDGDESQGNHTLLKRLHSKVLLRFCDFQEMEEQNFSPKHFLIYPNYADSL
jgi:hypothetical protein